MLGGEIRKISVIIDKNHFFSNLIEWKAGEYIDEKVFIWKKIWHYSEKEYPLFVKSNISFYAK